MWTALKHWILGKPPVEMEHEVFGHMLFLEGEQGGPEGYWECELPYANREGVLSVLVNAPLFGPDPRHVAFYQQVISNPDALFLRCWPVFEPDFEQWAGKPFSGNWQDDFELLSIEIPTEGDESNEWTVGYFVAAANHYFTARFINGKPEFNEIDG